MNAIGTVTRRHTPDQALPERIGIRHASEHGLDHGKFVATEAHQRVVRTQAQWMTGDRDPTSRAENVSGVIDTQYGVVGMPGGNAGVPPEAAALLNPCRDPRI